MKKPSIVSFLITLLLATTICSQGQEPLIEPLIDTDGNPVQFRDQYFLQPVNNKGGGLVPAAITLLPFCPLGITQTLLPYQPGLPISLSVGVAPVVGYLIAFRSDFWPVCKEFSKLWKVDDSSKAAKEPAILIGGDRRERNSYFRPVKAGANTYKLTTFAGTVGTIPGVWFNAPQLVVTNVTSKTLLFKFKKVDVATTTSTSRIGLASYV